MTIEVSIIIASNNAASGIEKCLGRLLQQIDHDRHEIIVADSSGFGVSALIKSQYSKVKLISYEQPASLPDMRGQAISVATGQIIAIIDPYSVVDDDWLAQLQLAHRNQDKKVIGGAVNLHQPDQQSLLAWAQYLNEYGLFMSPVHEGPAQILPGCNISYKRDVLFDEATPRFRSFWKTSANQSYTASGSSLWLTPGMRVELEKPLPFTDFLRTRYIHGRCYAGMRSQDFGPAMRLLRVLSAPLLPFVLQYRWSRRIWSKKQARAKFVMTLPLQLMLFASWSVGELVGYMVGSGNSCRRLFY